MTQEKARAANKKKKRENKHCTFSTTDLSVAEWFWISNDQMLPVFTIFQTEITFCCLQQKYLQWHHLQCYFVFLPVNLLSQKVLLKYICHFPPHCPGGSGAVSVGEVSKESAPAPGWLLMTGHEKLQGGQVTFLFSFSFFFGKTTYQNLSNLIWSHSYNHCWIPVMIKDGAKLSRQHVVRVNAALQKKERGWFRDPIP